MLQEYFLLSVDNGLNMPVGFFNSGRLMLINVGYLLKEKTCQPTKFFPLLQRGYVTARPCVLSRRIVQCSVD